MVAWIGECSIPAGRFADGVRNTEALASGRSTMWVWSITMNAYGAPDGLRLLSEKGESRPQREALSRIHRSKSACLHGSWLSRRRAWRASPWSRRTRLFISAILSNMMKNSEPRRMRRSLFSPPGICAVSSNVGGSTENLSIRQEASSAMTSFGWPSGFSRQEEASGRHG